MAETPHLIIDDEESCAYYGDRTARMAYSLYRKAEDLPVRAANLFRQHKFDLLRQGFLSETFSAAATLCSSCNACVPLRINVDLFKLSKNQKHMLRTADRAFETFHAKAADYPALWPLYKRYIEARHPESKMAAYTKKEVMDIFSSRTDIVGINGLSSGQIRAIALLDTMGNEASLDHVIFDPAFAYKNISLGRMAWIKAQEWAREQGITSLYIGAFNDSSKLAYKAERNPDSLEAFHDGEWKKFDPAIHRTGPDYKATLIKMGTLLPEQKL